MNQFEFSGDQLLSRASQAMRQFGASAGPSADLLAVALAAVEAAWQSPPRRVAGIRSPRLMVPLAAAVLLALGGFLYFGHDAGSPTVAWADVAAKICDARTLTYLTSSGESGSRISSWGKHYFKAPGLLRLESSNGLTSIMNGSFDNLLYLDTVTKTAYFNRPRNSRSARPKETAKAPTGTVVPGFDVTNRRESQSNFQFSDFDALKNLAKLTGEPIGKKMIGQIETIGFRIEQRGREYTVWVDPKSRLPLVIEQKITMAMGIMTSSMSDFVFDPPLDDALFSLTPPEGYTVSDDPLPILFNEQSLIEYLRLYADASRGTFPAKIDDWAEHDKVLKTDRIKSGIPTDPKDLHLAHVINRATGFVMGHKEHIVYRPAGVKLGEADKLLLWYTTEGVKKARAIYGDLHAADVGVDQLPVEPRQ